jgi:hypothetical protein
VKAISTGHNQRKRRGPPECWMNLIRTFNNPSSENMNIFQYLEIMKPNKILMTEFEDGSERY